MQAIVGQTADIFVDLLFDGPIINKVEIEPVVRLIQNTLHGLPDELRPVVGVQRHDDCQITHLNTDI